MLRAAALVARRARQAQPASYASKSLSRTFAAEAEPEIQVPIQVHGVAGRYASALYVAAAKNKVLGKVAQDLNQIYNMTVESKQFNSVLKDRSLPTRDKEAAVGAVLGKLGATDITKNFFNLLIDNNRLSEVAKISDTFDEICSAAIGEVKASVTSAEPLTAEERDELKNGLTKLLNPGETLLLDEKIDPKIIGGIVLDIGDKHVDLSIQSRVKKLQQLVREAV